MAAPTTMMAGSGWYIRGGVDGVDDAVDVGGGDDDGAIVVDGGNVDVDDGEDDDRDEIYTPLPFPPLPLPLPLSLANWLKSTAICEATWMRGELAVVIVHQEGVLVFIS